MLIPSQIANFIWSLCEVITTFIVIASATPMFLCAVVPIIVIFVIIQRLYIVTSRQLKRLYSVSKSPIFSHFSETVSGAHIIRAFEVRLCTIDIESTILKKTLVFDFNHRCQTTMVGNDNSWNKTIHYAIKSLSKK